MCYAILRVQYKTDKTIKNVDCDSPAHMAQKISEAQAAMNVSRIGVFLCDEHIELIEKWERKRYTPHDIPTVEGTIVPTPQTAV